MLILGRKYKFTKLELKILNKKFKNINFVSLDMSRYKDKSGEEIIEIFKDLLKENNFDLLVFNTEKGVNKSIIKYLTKLQFDKNAKKLRILTIEHFLEEFLYKCYIPDDYDNLSFLETIKPFNFFQYSIKRVIDIIGVIGMIIIGLPFMIYSYFKIKKCSPGPVFYKQKRVGYNNEEFVCIKFRSMKVDAEKDKIQFASENDDRIFPYGKFIRKTRIDELPQFINILKGEMHLIGPRPERKYWIDKFEEEIPFYSERHLVRPGLTGWAQVMYPYGANTEDTKQKLMYDLYYIKYWNLGLELKIIWKTIFVILNKEGV